ncbi:P-loop containing nucleoside triphosphate hydrolase protein [Aspergillus bertholletiae]|uniref:P-loop containing nucleoside triphosphate hydrolase protein n=1 Tax=Aspergillus bertholletiae TaxID=1226010 RepID=A0A5N7BGE1_9EURO|nr:P-loop containing nucleoside triphosphate hydrolase protein [Aspergillus bertholletiae]
MAMLSQLLLGKSSDPVSKKCVARRLWSTLPISGLSEAYSWADNKSAWRQGPTMVPLGKMAMAGPGDNPEVATVIFLIGGPGSGKSTVATKLAADLGLIHLNPDEIVHRLEITGPEGEWLAVESTMDEHGTVPDNILSFLLKIEISKHLNAHRRVFLIDDFPRSYAQFMDFTSICGYGLTISLDVSTATLMRRLMPETRSFSERVAQMEDFLKREDAFASAELALYPHANFRDSLVKVCAELQVEEFYPHLKDLVARKLASPKTTPEIKELGMEMVFSGDDL